MPHGTLIPGLRLYGTASRASGTIDGVTYLARDAGASGNDISVAVAAGGPAGRALSVGVSGKAITITPATDGAGAITTTRAQARDAINADAAASALVTANGGDATLVAATAATNLTGGVSRTLGRTFRV